MNEKTHSTSDQAPLVDDPVYVSSRREALVALAAWVVASVYTVAFCMLRGYDLDPAELKTFFGIPMWIVWGILFPWFASAGFCVWFSLLYVKDEDLGTVPEDDSDE